MVHIAICNEIFENLNLREICEKAVEYGYDGIEVAPYTLAEDIRTISEDERYLIRKWIKQFGLEIIAFHWLLVSPEGLHITDPNPETYSKTLDYFKALLDLGNDLNVSIFVFGSPKQRSIREDWNFEEAYEQAVRFFKEVSAYAEEYGIVIAYEPLGADLTNLGGTTQDAIDLVKNVDHPNFKMHLDVNAMLRDDMSIEEQIDLVDLQDLAHIHVNDPNNLGPGMGDVDYKPIIKKIKEKGYTGWLSVEPFSKDVPAEKIAKESITYLRSLL